MSPAAQPSLFDHCDALPHGLVYRPDFPTADEERLLLDHYDRNAE